MNNLKISFIYKPSFKYLEHSDNVKDIQELLSGFGYDIGNAGVDGIYGKDTKAALNEFIEIGRIKKGGSINEKILLALTESNNQLEGFKPLSWENGHNSRQEWSKFVFSTIDKLFNESFAICEDITVFRRDYESLNRNQKINVWGELISAISYYESGWDPTSRMIETSMETDPVTGSQVASEGLLQLSYQDGKSYSGKLKVECKFDWNKDKPLFQKNPKNPNITILNPYFNLEFGIGILAYQIKNYRKIILSKNVYWAVIKENGKYEKINKIIDFVERLKL
ncbi:peptidoglycan-binding domain-containing protein [Chryseobacterium indologenes]|uniref:peptidoglycan-binding domain-containing protein n=1 Tax=Chryseobacterium indologenes TaxID=253 RepID=UPI003015AE0C